MEFSRQGLEELFTDGVVNPAVMSSPYLKNCTKFKELESRVFVLYEPDPALHPNGAEFDIVLLHGIGSDEFNCWTNAQGIVWPAVFLPQDFPTARIVTVGYAHSLFNWKADESEAVEAAAEVASTPAATPSTATPAGGEPAGGEGGALHHIKSLADKVRQTAKEAVSTYAPRDVADWWVGGSGAQKGDSQAPSQASPKAVADTPAGQKAHTKHEPDGQAVQHASPQMVNNPLFQLLTRIRDSTGSLVAAEDEGGAASLSGGAHTTGGATRDKDKKATRDVRSLQNMRIVAAELADRLGSSKVGVGQRPVVFLVHSMGGLILKQMLISLFEAARLAPPSAAALSLAADSATDGRTSEEKALSQNCAAVRKANVLLRAVRGVVFYGTPHFGSAVASVITGLQKYYQGLGGLTPTSVVTGLGDHNKQELLRLNDRFFDVVQRLREELSVEAPGGAAPASQKSAVLRGYTAAMEASVASAQGVWGTGVTAMGCDEPGGGSSDSARGTVWILSFGETKKLNGLVRVVDPESANPAPDDPRYPFYLVNADHGEVCRPLTKMSPSYAMVYGLLDRMQQRGLLRWPRDQGPVSAALDEELLALASSAGGETGAGTSAVERMCERYEEGWSALFDPARASSAAPINVAASSPQSTQLSGASDTKARDGEARNFDAFQRGVGEMRLALPVLEEALADLHELLHRFFGVAVPPQIDSIFLLAADMTDFVTRFYRREALIVEGARRKADGAEATGAPDGVADGGVLVDEVVSFRVPLQLLTYWVQQATGLLRVFELTQQERSLGAAAAGGASPTAVRWESNLSMHPGGRDLRELSELEQSVGVVQEEWEAFRRYVSMRIRAVSPTSAAQHGDSPMRETGRPPQTPPREGGDAAEASVREHIAALFFARAIRTVVSQHLLDGGALGGLLGAYLRSAILQIHGAEKQLSSSSFQRSPWALLENDPHMNCAAIVALVMEGLELSTAAPLASEDASVLMDTSASGVSLNSDLELRAIVPALTATSSVLLGCFALFVDELHLLDSGARYSRAAGHFQLSTLALRADSHVRSRLLRAASRTMQREGLVSASPEDEAQTKTAKAEKEWWKSAWEMAGPKTASSDAQGSAAAAVALADGRQGHVAKLDDGLFLSAMQLTSASFQSAVLAQAYRDGKALLPNGLTEESNRVGACTAGDGDGKSRTDGRGVEEAPPSNPVVDDLLQSLETAQKAYDRTAKILSGVCVLIDAEKPFAPPERVVGSPGGDRAAGAREHPDKSRKDRLREAIQSILSELDQDEDEETNAGTGARGNGSSSAKKAKSLPSLSWTSRPPAVSRGSKSSDALATRSASTTAVTAPPAAASPKRRNAKNSLPMLVINSLSKAWEAVRSGGAEVETPERFAYTALVMWWMVEGETVAVLRDAAAAPSTPLSLAARVTIRTLLAKMEPAVLRRGEATKAPHPGAELPRVSASTVRAAAPLSKEEEKARAWERRCWSSANAATQCKWMTLRGGEEFQRKFQRDLQAERETLEKIVSSASPSQLRVSEESFEPPAALLQLDGEGGTQLGIPSSLLDAVQHDDASAALRCWLGHCYAVHRMRSPDTAHAYLQVIRNDYAAHKRYTPTAEVGLAWNHLHSVPCSFAQLWRLSRGAVCTGDHVASSEGAEARGRSRGEVDARAAAALLDFGSTGVVDTFALHSVPLPLLLFFHGAVRHHIDAVDEFIGFSDPRQPTSASWSPRVVPSKSSAMPNILSLQAPPAQAGLLRHLQLAEAGFQRALSANPASVGALCGLGRLRCLSVSSPPGSGGGHGAASAKSSALPGYTPFSHEAGLAAPQRASGAAWAEAAGFFQAALNAGGRTRLLSEGELSPRLASAEGCAHALDSVWLSYAAYWMSEEARRSRVGSNAAAPESNAVASTPQATEWLVTSLRYYPRNDWALTSLGLSHLADSVTPHPSPHAPEATVTDTQGQWERGPSTTIAHLRGLALLQRALAINPNNMWALWGMGTYGTSPAHRSTCQRLLRRLVLQRIPKL